MIEVTKTDSSVDTLKHRGVVEELCNLLAVSLVERAKVHDESKLYEPEKSAFDNNAGVLATLKYGTKEYDEHLAKMKPALDHHRSANRHHPEYHDRGLFDMTLVDLAEMLCDWIASCRRTSEGDIFESLKINKKRFDIDDMTYNILWNTAEYIMATLDELED